MSPGVRGGDLVLLRKIFPEARRRWLVSPEGGLWPAWIRDGKELFCHATDGFVVAVAAESRGEGLAFGALERLFPLPIQQTDFRHAPVHDGERFLAIEPVEGEEETALDTVVVNRLDERDG